MKKNILILLITVFIAALCALGFAACRGEKGNTGKDGVSVSGAFVDDGDLYLVLTNGVYVNCGHVAGSNGSDGIDGLDGVGIVDITYNKDGELIIKFANGDERNIGISPNVCTHTYPDEWTVETVADCTTQGYKYMTCTSCGFVRTEITPAKGHNWDELHAEEIIQPETCTDEGWALKVCKTCRETKLVKTEAGEHQFTANYYLYEEDRYVTKCYYCDMRKPSEGLEFARSGNEYYLKSLGTCTDTDIVVPDVIKNEKGETVPVTKIGRDVFRGLEIKSVYLSKNITSFEEQGNGSPFGNADCEKMTNITINKYNKVYRSDGNCIIDINAKTVVAGCAASSIPSDGSVTAVGSYAFKGVKLKNSKLVIPDKIVTLGSSAFEGSSGFTELSLGGDLYTIGVGCFNRCTSLEKLTVSNVPEICVEAFYECLNLKEVNLKYGCKIVGVSAFAGCKSLQTVYIPATVTRVGSSAFGNCPALLDLNYAGSQTDWWRESTKTGVADKDWNASDPFLTLLGIGATPITNAEINYH